jgi:AcrR family transcriptional regulator
VKRESSDVAEATCVPRPRDRIVASAQDLFHKHGIRGVGVETIADAAGTNKMTLYRHFDSKDELILEYLKRSGRTSSAATPAIPRLSCTTSSSARRFSSPRTSAAATLPTPPLS